MKKNKKYIILIGVIALLLVGYFIADSLLFDGVKPRAVNDNGFQANYFVKNTTKNKATVMLVGGGQWGDYWAQQFAEKEFSGLSIPYVGKKGLPELPEEIDLKYFENAVEWLIKQPEVNPDKILIMGASRNAELALVIASTFPTMLSGVVAYSPSAVSWSNTVLPYNSNELKPSWTYKGVAIPYLPMNKIKGNDSDKIVVSDYWKNGLAKADLVQEAIITVEKINGPVLLFSGKDDQVWPSSTMADMIEQRLDQNNFQHAVENIQYENAGHLISRNPERDSSLRTGTMKIKGKDYKYEFGGTQDGDHNAKRDAKQRVMHFLEKI